MSILSLIKRAPKRTSAVLLMIAAAIIIPASLLAWGPNRTLYTTAHPAGHVTFNSITDNPVQGYEPNFMRVKAATAANSTYADSIKIQAGQEYTVFVYYHNNASSTLNASGVGIANGAYVRAEIPAVVNGSTSSVAHIGASNATPVDVWDDATFTSDSSTRLSFVPGSAHIYNKGATNGATLSDTIVTTGAPIGYDALNGVVPGCNGYAGYVTFNVKASVPDFTVQKQVRLAGTTTYSENVTANPGDNLNYRIEYKNTGATSQPNVVVKDVLPVHINYVAGSTTIKNGANPSGKAINDDIFTAGVNIGTYGPGANAFLYFNATVGSADSLICGPQTLTNTAKATFETQTKQDTATVNVTKTCAPENITVCELSTKKIVTINKNAFDTTKYSTDLSKCDEAKKITVCNLSTKAIVSINEADFDSTKYSKNLNDCELPHTGPTENIVAFLGLGALAASVVYYVRSRRIEV